MAEKVKEKEDRLEEEEYYTGIEPFISKDAEPMISTIIVLVAVAILAVSIISTAEFF